MKAFMTLLLLISCSIIAPCEDILSLLAGNDVSKLKGYVLQNDVNVPEFRIGEFGLLFYACALDVNQDILKYLIDSGCDINEQVAETKITPLMVAARRGSSVAIIKALLANGADIHKKDMHGKSALLLSVASDDTVASTEQWDFMRFSNNSARRPDAVQGIIETMLSSGADINERDSDSFSILHVAAQDASYKLMAFLISKGGNVAARDVYGATPLFYAAGSNTVDVVQLLLNAGTQVDARNKYGATALFSAVADSPYPEVVEALVKAGLDLNSRGLGGATAAAWGFLRNKNLTVLDKILSLKPNLVLVDDSGNDIMFYANINKTLANTDTYWHLNDAYWAVKRVAK